MPAARRILLALLVAALVAPATAGCLRAVTGSIVVGASAPQASAGMSLFVAEQSGVLDAGSKSDAEYVVSFGDKVVYPPGGRGAVVKLSDGQGTAFVPYDVFVVGNGEYDVTVRHEGQEARTRVAIHKWASYVYVRAFDRGSGPVEVVAALQSATGGRPEDRILAEGELLVSIHFRGLRGDEDRPLGMVRAQTNHDATSTTVPVDRGRLSAGPGYYSFEPLFHNAEAKNNVQVKADPTLANRFPPWNWIHFTR